MERLADRAQLIATDGSIDGEIEDLERPRDRENGRGIDRDRSRDRQMDADGYVDMDRWIPFSGDTFVLGTTQS